MQFFGKKPTNNPLKSAQDAYSNLSLEKILASLADENLKWDDIKNYQDLKGSLPENLFFLRRLAISECASNRLVCALTLNSSKYFSFVAINMLDKVLETLSTFVDSTAKDPFEIEIAHIFEDEQSQISSVILNFCRSWRQRKLILFIDSVLKDGTIMEGLTIDAFQLSFVRCSDLIEDPEVFADQIQIHTTELVLNNCADSFVKLVTQHLPKNGMLKRLVMQNENNLGSDWPKILQCLSEFHPNIEMSIALQTDTKSAKAIIFELTSLNILPNAGAKRLEQEIQLTEEAQIAALEALQLQRDDLFYEEGDDWEESESNQRVASVSSMGSIPWNEDLCPVQININGAFSSISIRGPKSTDSAMEENQGTSDNGFVKLRRPDPVRADEETNSENGYQDADENDEPL